MNNLDNGGKMQHLVAAAGAGGGRGDADGGTENGSGNGEYGPAPAANLLPGIAGGGESTSN